MARLFWLMLPIVAVTVAGFFVIAALTVDMVDLKTMPIIAGVGFVVGIIGTVIVAKMVGNQRKA